MTEYAVEMENITKIFHQNIIVNDNISLKIKKGEIHALVGENGAGKSTLMSILFGLYQPNKGTIKINGKEVVINNSIKATALKIGMVHQHFYLVEHFTILQNIILGNEPLSKIKWINYKKATAKITAIANSYKLQVDLKAKIYQTTVSVQQKVEILKVLYRGADIIVFDEPTAVLTPQEITALLEIIKQLRDTGKTIIFISHKLEEVQKIAETITVIRHGKVVASFPARTKTVHEIATLMVGRDLVTIKNSGTVNATAPVLLKMVNVNINKTKHHIGLQNINLEIKAGEILALAGVEGNGQTELIYSLTGLMKISSGKIYLQGKDVTNFSARLLYREGLSHIPEDRHKYGVVLDYSVIDNIVLQDISKFPFAKHGLLQKKAIQSYAQKIIAKYDVRGSKSGFSTMRVLSGGNQQKVVVGRELSRNPQIVVIAQPTRGLDIGAIEYIHKKILAVKEKGNAVLLASYELSEIMALADRILVLHAGQITGNVSAKNIKRETLGLMMAGKKWLHIEKRLKENEV